MLSGLSFPFSPHMYLKTTEVGIYLSCRNSEIKCPGVSSDLRSVEDSIEGEKYLSLII